MGGRGSGLGAGVVVAEGPVTVEGMFGVLVLLVVAGLLEAAWVLVHARRLR